MPTQSNLQALGESVEYTLGMGHAVFLSMKDVEEAAKKMPGASPTGDVSPPQDDDAVRPGRGLGLVVGMLVETATGTGRREAVVSILPLEVTGKEPSAKALGDIPSHSSYHSPEYSSDRNLEYSSDHSPEYSSDRSPEYGILKRLPIAWHT